MGEIKRPPTLTGTAEEKIGQIWDYLFNLSEELRGTLNGIGSNELTDAEREIMRPYFQNEMKNGQMISMKDMIIRTAGEAQSGIKEARDKAAAALAIGKAFVDGTDCGANTNLNNLTEQGTYYFTTNAAGSASNAPYNAAFTLYVIRRRNSIESVTQFAIYTAAVYRRSNDPSQSENYWQNWTQLV